MNAAEASGRDARAWAAAFADGRARPAELLERCLGRIGRYDSGLAICNHVGEREDLLHQAAASQARWRRGAPLSPLDGVPFGVKANVAVEGYPWHGGISAFRERRASTDADCVRRLRAAGMIPMAVFNMHEAALGATTNNPAFGTTRNPHDRARIPGGSSGGSAAAVAAGFAPLALGTDDLGSVRLPAALCGVVGFKPGRDEIPAGGVMPLCRRLDHVGVLGRSVGDVGAVAGLFRQDSEPADHTDRAARRVGGIARLARWTVTIREPACGAIDEAFNRLVADHGVSRDVDWTDVDLSALRRAGLLLCERDGAELFSRALSDNPDGFSRTFRRLVEWGAAQPPERVRRAERLLEDVRRRLCADLGENLLVSPTTPHLAPALGDEVPVTLADLTAPAAIAGVPAISVPMETSGKGLPMGLQISGLASTDVLQAAGKLFPGVAGCVP
ncbi:MAG: amidase [Gammaproteobacteria bacterium]|nr:amidase [Gammaproteobacteria bacterium]